MNRGIVHRRNKGDQKHVRIFCFSWALCCAHFFVQVGLSLLFMGKMSGSRWRVCGSCNSHVYDPQQESIPIEEQGFHG